MPTGSEMHTLNHDIPETFRFFTWLVDVQKAKQILAGKKKPLSGEIQVSDVSPLVGAPEKIVMGVRVDWDRVQNDKTIDLTVPVILAYTEHGNIFPIDGWHRIAKAVLQGVKTLPCLIVNKTDSKKIVIR